jgi:hypothetical protein
MVNLTHFQKVGLNTILAADTIAVLAVASANSGALGIGTHPIDWAD